MWVLHTPDIPDLVGWMFGSHTPDIPDLVGWMADAAVNKKVLLASSYYLIQF